MVTEGDLNYYFDVVETMWVGGTSPTFERIRLRIRLRERDSAHLAEGLAVLVARQWLKVQQVPLTAWALETGYETWYIPIRDHDPGSDYAEVVTAL